MPFVIFTGLPSSGKSSRVKELEKQFAEKKAEERLVIVEDDYGKCNKNDLFSDSRKEIDQRATLKAQVERVMSKDAVVVLDSLNYIKGFRYELYCIVKAAKTPHCVIHVDTSVEQSYSFNANRPNDEKYTDGTFNALVMRFEAPNGQNRWDAPLFVLHPADPLPFDAVCDALFKRKAPPPNMSTQTLPASSTNFLYELDKVTQDMVTLLWDAQKTCSIGDDVCLLPAKDKLQLVRQLNMAELRRLRRQFISYTKTRPIDDKDVLANMFVQYLNNSIR